MLTTLALPGHSLPVPSEGPLWPCPLLPGRRLRLRLAILARVAFDRDAVPGDGEEPRPALALDPDRDLLLKVFEEYPRGTRWFGELVDRHWDRTWACCMSVLLNPQDAEEAVQDAFLKAHRYLPSFRSEARFGTWMLRIARRVALDALAGRRRADDALGRIIRDPILRRRWSPAPAADPAARERDLMDVLERLDPVDRLVLVLHDLNGVPFDEIAETLEAAPAAVRMRASRARARVRESLRRTDWSEP